VAAPAGSTLPRKNGQKAFAFPESDFRAIADARAGHPTDDPARDSDGAGYRASDQAGRHHHAGLFVLLLDLDRPNIFFCFTS
jgi:hypothetical protein